MPTVFSLFMLAAALQVRFNIEPSCIVHAYLVDISLCSALLVSY